MNFFTGDQDDTSCNDYHVLNDPTRNMDYGNDDGGFCDSQPPLWDRNLSPQWKGPAWYRFTEPAGTRMPEEPVEGGWRCNTQVSGWLNGSHPTTPGETIDGTVCFSASNGNNCYRTSQIKVKHCGSYYLYYLVNASGCNRRYCATRNSASGNYLPFIFSAYAHR